MHDELAMRLSKLPGGASKASYTRCYISTPRHVSSTEASDLFGFVRYCYVCHFILRAVLCIHVYIVDSCEWRVRVRLAGAAR